MKRATIFIIALVSFFFVISCWGITEIGTPSYKEILPRYYFGGGIEISNIVRARGNRTPPEDSQYLVRWVQDVDWNGRFIVAKNFESYERAHANPPVYSWYIIDTVENQVYGPFLYDEYLQKRNTLGVPDEIEILRPGEKELEVYGRKHIQR